MIKTIKHFFAKRAHRKEQAYQDHLWALDKNTVDAVNDVRSKFLGPSQRPIEYRPRRIIQ